MKYERFIISILCLAFLLGVIFAASSVSATSPFLLPLQAKVKKVGGKGVADGTYPVTFRLYRVATEGSSIWSETQSGVAVKNGVFSVLLGSTTSLAGVDFSSGDFYLGLEFNGDGEMAPRMRLASSLFSLESRELQGKEPDDFLLTTGNQTLNGTLNVTGDLLQGGNELTDFYVSLGGSTLTGPITVAGVSGLTDSDIPDTVTASRYLPLQGGTLTGEVTFASGQSFPGTVSTAGGTVTGPLAIQGSSGTLTVAGATTLQGASTFQGTSTLSGAATISGALTVSSSASFSGSVSVSGLFTANAGLTLSSGTLSLPNASIGNAALQSSVSLLGQTVESAEITDLTIVNGDVNVTAAIVYGKLNLAGSLTNADLVAGAFSNITGVGALGAGSITAGFDAIDVGDNTITTTGTVTGGTVNATTAVQTGGTNRIDATGNLLAIGNLTGTAAITIASSGATNDVIINGADILDVQDAAVFASTLIATGLLTANNGFTLTTGTLTLPSNSIEDADLSSNVALLNRASQTFTNTNIIQTTTAPQLSVRSDASNRLDMSIGATGGVTLDAVGAGAAFTISDGVSFSSTVNSNLAFANSLILGTAGGNTITIGATSGATATINLDQSTAVYTFKTRTRNVVIPAKACEAGATPPTATNVGDSPVWRMDEQADPQDSILCSFTLPDDWSSGTNLTAIVVSSGTTTRVSGVPLNGCAEGVTYQTQYVAVSTGDSATAVGATTSGGPCFLQSGIGTTYTANTRVQDDGVSLTGSSFAAGDVVSLEITRLSTNAGDVYCEAACSVDVHEIIIQYTATTPFSG